MPRALASLAPARRRLVLGLVTALVVVVVAAAVWVFARGRSSADVAVEQSRPGPVLLVPGYGGSTQSLTTLASALRQTGRDVTIVTLPGQALGDLTDQATTLGAAADAARKRSGGAPVDVVGYSAGGVVARIWALEDGGAQHLRRLVTLGSPFHGTDLAQLGSVIGGSCPVACQQLAPDSPVLDQLAITTQPKGPAYVSIWSTSDDVVLPPDSAVLPGVPSPSLQSICPSSRTRHSDLPTDPQVIAMVTEALAAAPIPTWTAADCARLSS
jgi:triacylglycerol lipase